MIKQKHQQLYDILKNQLHSGRWAKGEKLPTIRELAVEYNVSINVASKAVEMLKRDGMVSVKVGDGIFSQTSRCMPNQGMRFSGNRIFGHYSSAKTLRVIVEDVTPLQLNFWNSFFETVASRHLDIEVEITYGTRDETGFDLAFGSLVFLLAHGFNPAHTLNDNARKLFHPEFYTQTVLNPENCRMGDYRNYFPYGFISNDLLSNSPLPPPEEQETVLDYVARLATKNGDRPVGYGIFSGMELLNNAGILFCNPENGTFRMPDTSLLKETFEKCAVLYNKGHLIWEHGNFHDIRSATIAEVPFNHDCGESRDPRQHYPLPPGKEYHLIPVFCAISFNTLFPEECCRLLGTLLTPEFQAKGEAKKIFQAIFPVKQDSRIRGFIGKLPPVITNAHNAGLFPVLQYFVPWELYHYITGQTDFNPARLESKIRWYLDIISNRKNLQDA